MDRAKYAEKVLTDWDENPEVRAEFNDDIHVYWRHMKNEKIKAEYERIEKEAPTEWSSSPDLRSRYKNLSHYIAHRKAAFAREFNKGA